MDQSLPSSPRALFDRIGDMLFTNGLDPSPVNYTLGHRYCTGEDPTFNQLIDETIELVGGLSPVAASAIVAERSVELSAVDLSRLAGDAQDRLAQISELLGRSSADTARYGAALETRAARLAAGEDPAPLVEALVELTTAMIERTREVEGHLRRTSDDLRGMRASLADATATAHRDALTGLPNRRALDARLAAAVDAARRSGRPMTVAICDIDHFKAFNDSYGHQIGDEVIKFVASSFPRSEEKVFAARYGGEEFVVLFEGVDVEAAAAEIERTRAALYSRELKVTATGQSLGRLSFSAGLATFQSGDGAYALLKRADNALYSAKRAGRNRVERG